MKKWSEKSNTKNKEQNIRERKKKTESMMVWMKIALDKTHLYAERQEYCHYVAAMAFR